MGALTDDDDGRCDPEFAAINLIGDILAVIDDLDDIGARLYGYSEHKETAAQLDDIVATVRKIAAGISRTYITQPKDQH